MAATVSFPCPDCQAPLERPLPDAAPTPCARCGKAIALHADALEAESGASSSASGGASGTAATSTLRVVACPACGEKLLYKQKDFRQAIGCLVVLVAAALAPFTYYASLGVAALIDLVLYRLSGEVVICYRIPCKAHVRGVAPGSKVGAFDLSIHDYYRMLARRAEQGLAGPDETTGPPLDAMSHHRH
ncbi:MAG: hypothetical protein JNL90_05040 [Planctomycetes bacterium]|nr:hypothetical protein [Planctomycetota bacterium]